MTTYRLTYDNAAETVSCNGRVVAWRLSQYNPRARWERVFVHDETYLPVLSAVAHLLMATSQPRKCVGG